MGRPDDHQPIPDPPARGRAGSAEAPTGADAHDVPAGRQELRHLVAGQRRAAAAHLRRTLFLAHSRRRDRPYLRRDHHRSPAREALQPPVGELKPEAEVTPDPLALLRQPFPANQISKLPKESKAQADKRKAEQDKGNWPARCDVCGGLHHAQAVHLDYVGHAAATDRLLDADPRWNWEPMGLTPEGLPAFDRNGGLWIKLTVDGVTRIGYGSADGKSGGDAIKEIIGDAIRNSGMRFGMALDLWHKGDLHAHQEDPIASLEERAIAHLRACAIDKAQFKDAWEGNREGWKKTLEGAAYARVVKVMREIAATFPKDEPQAAAGDLGIGDDDLPEGLR
jgi:hypothetical protein